MMKMRILFLGLLLTLSCGLRAQNYGGGSGTDINPYIINLPEHLSYLSSNTGEWGGNKYFELGANIDMSGVNFTPIGNSTNVFHGHLNGKNYAISNLTITGTETADGTGLFGSINGSVTQLGIVNVSTNNTQNFSRVGAIAGILEGGTISQCYSTGGTLDVGSGGWTGGIVGILFSGGTKTVENCYSTTTVTGSWGCGGIVGVTRGAHVIDKVAFYGSITNNGNAIVTIQNDAGNDNKNGIAPTNSYFKSSTGVTDENATGLTDSELTDASNYSSLNFTDIWKIDNDLGYAVLQLKNEVEPELDFFDKIRLERVESSDLVDWKQFGPGMSGYNEEFWCHPTDKDVMFMGPDMHVAYGTWDNGLSWHTIKDSDGDGLDLERVNDIAFSTNNPDFGVAIERRGKVFETNDRGRTWKLVYLIPHAAESPWYNAHSKLAIDPGNDNIWYIGAGGFWDVKGNFRSKAKPHGTHRPIHAYGYILKTTDGGVTWKKIATGISDDLDVGRILINPNDANRIVIATGQGIFLSTDAGETWNASSSGLPNNLPKDLAAYYNPDTKEYILYTVEQSVYTESGNTIATEGGVFKSTDGGETWLSITGNLGLDFTVITDYAHRDRYANTVAFWLGKNKSEIASKAYPSHTLQVFRRLVVNPLNKNEIYLVPNQRHDKSFGPGDIWKTEDGGANWKIVARHGTYWHAGSNKSYWEGKGMVTTPNVEFAHLQESLNESHESASANRMLAINVEGHVFIGINQQTHRSNNGGESWQQVDDYETAPGSNAWIGRGASNLPGRFILSKTGIPDRMLLCSGEHGLWQTSDIGDWPDKDAVATTQIEGQVHDINGNHGAHSISTVAVHPNDPNTIFILSWRQEHRGWLRKSTDGGKTWNNVVQLFDSNNGSWEATASQYSLQIDPVNHDNMYFTAIYKPISCGTNTGPGKDLTMGEYGVYRSTDGGNTWQVSNQDFPANSSVNRIIMHPDNPETLFAALNQWGNNDPYGLYKSTDKAVSWTKMTIPSAIRSVNNIFIDPNTKYMYISCGARTGNYNAGGVYRSKDDGATWELFFKAPYVWHTETSPVNSDIILVHAAGQVGGAFKNPGFYLSRDDGETWVKINNGIGQPDKMVDIELHPYKEDVLWSAAWGSGWYKGMIKTDEVKAVCSDVTANMGDEVTLYGHGSVGSQLEYNWTVPEQVTDAKISKYKITFTAPDVENDSILKFKLTVNNDGGSDEIEVKVTIKKIDTSLKYPSRKNMVIYPNPATDVLTISGINEPAIYSAMSATGITLITTQDNNMNVSALSAGNFILKVKTQNKITFHKFVKK